MTPHTHHLRKPREPNQSNGRCNTLHRCWSEDFSHISTHKQPSSHTNNSSRISEADSLLRPILSFSHHLTRKMSHHSPPPLLKTPSLALYSVRQMRARDIPASHAPLPQRVILSRQQHRRKQ